MNAISYPIGDSLYINVTNRCTNHCYFCIRYKTKQFNQEHELWLEKEPTVEEVLEAIGDPSKYEQIVFCGYGEPLIRLDIVKAVAKRMKSKIPSSKIKTNSKSQAQNPKIRLDTNGQANLFWGRNVLPELKDLIDIISISLDAENAELYQKICQSKYNEEAYAAVLDFIKEAKKYIPEVIASVVDLPEVDKEACRRIAEELGVKFRVRPYYEETYVK
ncbi:radical SAM protein [candidate division WOR-1 bacterium RIFOXYB2_FULL_42_35]|uniref:Radical SAM protein n=1 Tax=candidate division WOR-1 bacterium RIFOXYC2_FULL_41_25 TaxID=1802586 RepID=A0A1F4TLM1_UNCSA|nr:MAG: radical SAM protein [candidate division WOR-1 bacterium RIFOXYA2_FULL_41_14]OGC23622.1 MAG: radical SAM protein [candidate division WOR-1 bacterium RIFOXYB2_FULL_42_35]OGC33586.1 MAG: radical SAM protein [candidate division WOR-1 bacterium RIFOXYC2_FULL_41_25]OGC41752.1 MAG: radical SAM protein [candidate division WOR-1 bacterium RIFOXYD2_FULL_41_8]